ncbi:60S ribosomal protein L31-B [Rhodotorula toruloides]|uniref:BY PROTMAP: gi/472586916/gb/EMS24415.1/ large subunit ribosomal protein L31e [Rhodosporidium toruloides NP11] gi/647394905/emb/CDR36140.1/ RHTO0S01e15148g1_1 [Rhodosporidium toruloides] n=1 Tax=Rhodotorula toruloides TaxID=5286 RepID=A0A0K3C8A6_RHOTO|nr:60S ribosomal protein L31-B [Rhodotorula toruloides]PRQ78081.1 Ribosomal protein L31e-domain containing protein [Rhodotorula toruloides]
MARGQSNTERKTRSALTDVVAREYTIHLHTKVHGKGFKHRAPSAVKAVRTFAQKAMGTKKVLLEPSVNAAIWGKGIKNVPHRLRVRLHRKRNDDESAKEDEKLYTLVSVVPTTNFKGLNTTVVEADE